MLNQERKTKALSLLLTQCTRLNPSLLFGRDICRYASRLLVVRLFVREQIRNSIPSCHPPPLVQGKTIQARLSPSVSLSFFSFFFSFLCFQIKCQGWEQVLVSSREHNTTHVLLLPLFFLFPPTDIPRALVVHNPTFFFNQQPKSLSPSVQMQTVV